MGYQEHSFSRLFVPRLFVPIMELLFSTPFVPGNECSREHSFPGPFDTLKFLIFLYHKRKSAVQNGQLYFYVNTQTSSENLRPRFTTLTQLIGYVMYFVISEAILTQFFNRRNVFNDILLSWHCVEVNICEIYAGKEIYRHMDFQGR